MFEIVVLFGELRDFPVIAEGGVEYRSTPPLIG